MPSIEGDDWWRRGPISDGDADESPEGGDYEEDRIGCCPYCHCEIADSDVVRCPYCKKYILGDSYRSGKVPSWVKWTAVLCTIIAVALAIWIF